MAFWNKTDRAYKTLINRVTTDQNKAANEEYGDFTINVHADEIWSEPIPGVPPVADTAVVKVYSSASPIRLCEDLSVLNGATDRPAWFATSYFTDNGITNPTLSQIQAANDARNLRLKDWISAKYNSPSITLDQGYQVLLYDKDNNLIPSSDASGWFFDYQTGILAFSSGTLSTGQTLTQAAPFKIAGWRYIGDKGAGGGTVDGAGTGNALAMWTDANTLGDSIATQTNGGTTIQVAGHFTARTKSFTIDHPLLPDRLLVHGSLEGPEHGIYQHGSAEGMGAVRVELPDYFIKLTGGAYRVMLTSTCSAPVRLYKQDETGFVVCRCGGWFSRRMSVSFNYFVVGARTDAPLVVEPVR